MSNTSILQKILYRIDNDDKISASNIIEKLKSELQQQHVNMYNAWEENGFDINANSFDGSNLLCLASGSGCAKVVELLIEKEANVNVRDNEGKTPLDYAISSGREEVIEILTGKILLSDEGLTSKMSSEQEVEIDSQYETLPSCPFFF
ncbi:ankyrin repeat domain-containing protein [Wolbachia endosymbiont (group B) of Erebia ligea]|uniref:ankyrin repeat domain-containing protein n=1 Tax=Wolbachia endosymbiont (group B) of Erebia ligea TaxID=2954010 RepID=UPI0021F871D8|nr:ankyrin repeat domain-containing protein [Wolbachia endosymbiont (group B) of Erebia ligea]